MEKKKIITLVSIVVGIILILGMVVFSFKKKPISGEQKIIELLSEIQGYTSDISIKVINNKETNNYEGTQVYLKSKGYKLDLNDERTFIFRGDDIEVKDNNSNREYVVEKEFDEVFKYGFIGEYIGLIYTNEELKFEIETIDSKEYFVITTIIPGSNNNLHEGRMYYDIAEYRPSKIILYDNKQKERVIYNYNNFYWTDDESDINVEF